jgi:hypothetical protein
MAAPVNGENPIFRIFAPDRHVALPKMITLGELAWLAVEIANVR